MSVTAFKANGLAGIEGPGGWFLVEKRPGWLFFWRFGLGRGLLNRGALDGPWRTRGGHAGGRIWLRDLDLPGGFFFFFFFFFFFPGSRRGGGRGRGDAG